jgi:hypothetical protein
MNHFYCRSVRRVDVHALLTDKTSFGDKCCPVGREAEFQKSGSDYGVIYFLNAINIPGIK